jgi:HEAT repeat protein
MTSGVKQWLDSVPISDDRHAPVQQPAASWQEWTERGRDVPDLAGGLIEMLREDPDPVWRSRAAFGLGFVGTRSALGPLVVALGDEPVVAMEAAAALGRLAFAESVEALCRALRNDDANVRANAATALGRFADDAARERLRAAAASDPSDLVRRAAADALSRQ